MPKAHPHPCSNAWVPFIYDKTALIYRGEGGVRVERVVVAIAFAER